MCMGDLGNWQEYITRKYLEWRQDKYGRAGSAARFAAELGITTQLLSEWMNRGKTPQGENINLLVDYFGYEIYDVLGLRRPEPDDPRTALLAAGFEVDFVDALLAAQSEVLHELTARGMENDSPEAREIIRMIFRKHGIHLTETE